MGFEILGKISDIETIAVGNKIRERDRLQRTYGRGRWRKRKGIAHIQLDDGSAHMAELHWYEAHGIGRQEFKSGFFRLLAASRQGSVVVDRCCAEGCGMFRLSDHLMVISRKELSWTQS